MDLRLIIIALIAFVVSLIILKLLAKTFKFIVFIIIFVVVFGVMYYGYSAFFGKLSWGVDQITSSNNPPAKIGQSEGCSSDSDCAFISSQSDCNLVVNACNNVRDSSKFFNPSTKTKCSIDSVVIDVNVKCQCLKSSSGSSCQRL